jgi:hypothetical protein
VKLYICSPNVVARSADDFSDSVVRERLIIENFIQRRPVNIIETFQECTQSASTRLAALGAYLRNSVCYTHDSKILC